MPKMLGQRIILLIIMMVVIVTAVLGTSMNILYQTAIEQQRQRLVETVKSQAALMEAVARFDAEHSQNDVVGGSIAATMGQIFEAFKSIPSESQTFEFVLARKLGKQIEFLATRRAMGLSPSFRVPIVSPLAEPMRKALAGESGVIIAQDYQGNEVLAAFEHVPVLNLGIVAKLDLWEIREPFVRSIYISILATLLFTALGAWLFHFIGSPLVRSLAASESRHRSLAEELKESNLNLEQQVNERTHNLQEEQERSQLLLESVSEGIYGLDMDGKTIFVNPAAAVMLGYATEEMIGKSMHALVHHSYPDGSPYPVEKCPMYAAFSDGDIYNIDDEVLWRKDGSNFPVRYSSTPMKKGDEVIGAVITFSDISLEREVRNALEKEHRFNQRLVHTIPSILISTDINRNITLWNSAAEQVFGIPSSAVIGKHVMDSGVECDWRKVAKAVVECRHKGYATLDHFSFARLDGHDGFLDLSFTPIIEDEAMAGYMLLGSDITVRIQLQNQLQLSQKMEAVGELAAGIAHEINTPLQYVGDNLRFLKESFSEMQMLCEHYHRLKHHCADADIAGEIVEALNRADEEADMEFIMEEIPASLAQSLDGIEKASRIVSAMKEFSHPGQREKSLTDLNRMLENTATVCRNEWKYVADLNTDLDEDMPLVRCLPEINQVFLNMIINGAHAIAEKIGEKTAEKGIITLRTSYTDRFAQVDISDTGSGIPEALRQKVFEPFFTTKTIGKGTGQGLAISHNIIVDQHDGTLDVLSEEGEGSTFTIRIPIDSGQSA